MDKTLHVLQTDSVAAAAGRLRDSLEPEELLPSADDRVSAVGRHRGVERATGRRVDAAFAHAFLGAR